MSMEKKLDFVMVTPFVDEIGLKKIDRILKSFSGLGMFPEIIFNDWGVFNLIRNKYSEFKKLSMGRLLNRMKRDPRIKFLKTNIPDYVKDHLKDSSLSIDWYKKFIIKNNITRIELDNLTQGIASDFSGKYFIKNISLYYPFGYLTTTRLCRFNYDRKKESPGFRINTDCKRYCKDMYAEVRYKGLEKEKIYVKGNTFFIKTERQIVNDRINRIVFNHI